MKKTKTLKLKQGERVFVFPGKKSPNGFKYAVTSFGRVISFTTEPLKGRFMNLTKTGLYPSSPIYRKGRNQNYLVHRLVAEGFVKRKSAAHRFVIHLNYNKEDNHYRNLRWVTHQQKVAHIRKDPNPLRISRGNTKLTEEKVRQIKKALLRKNATLKILGKRFKVSDMQIHRIKTGENWSKVEI